MPTIVQQMERGFEAAKKQRGMARKEEESRKETEAKKTTDQENESSKKKITDDIENIRR